ncbi:MAG: hypothetical protein KJ077_07995 [Anaerolineae bacterium]|nr:hypothetical protein [Anaerolineae bacterium]
MADYFGLHNRVRVRDLNGRVVIDWRAHLFYGDVGVFLLNEGMGRIIVQRQTGFLGLFEETYALAYGESYEAFYDGVWAFVTFIFRSLLILIPGLLALMILYWILVNLPFNLPVL